MLALFVLIEARFASRPLMPLRLFRSRNLSAANVIIMLVGGSTFAMWFFVTLYLQQVNGESPLHAGITFLPMTIAIVIGSTVVGRIVIRVGPKRLLTLGMLLLGSGLLLFTDITPHGSYLGELLLPGLLVAFGMSLAFIPGTICATQGIAPREAGLASAVVNTARLFGGALGLAILAAIATSHTSHVLHHPTAAIHTMNQALVDGFQLSFTVAAIFAFAGAVIAAFGMPSAPSRPQTTPPLREPSAQPVPAEA
jgi:predicted MFS family arabinose efflux permease